MRLLNLGCGSHYHPDWVNVDFHATNPNVLAHNLSTGVPFGNETFNMVYHSHLLEHFPKEKAGFFIQECYRVLRQGGIIRVVVPDLEQMCRLYLRALEMASMGEEGWSSNYEWIMLELYDQCVRNISGGQMLQFLMREPLPNEEFVASRLGSFYRVLMNDIKLLKNQPERKHADNKRTLTNEEIGEFRNGGEIHQWMYDRYSLRLLLEEAGFHNVVLRTAQESYCANWPSFCLDTDSSGEIYKADSLFMEGIK